jgi:hypothetical protein
MRANKAVLLALGAMLAGGSANAQLRTLQKPVSVGVRAGGYFPKGHSDGIGKSWLALGVDARVNIAALPIIGGQTVSLDYLKSGGSNITAVTLVQRFTSPIAAPVAQGLRPYIGLGLGYYHIHGEGDEGSDTKNTVGAKIVVGADIGQGLYIEGDYHLPAGGSVAGLNPKGLAITAGLRF